MKTRGIFCVLAVLLSGCATSPQERAARYEEQGEWLKAVTEYRIAYERNPRNVEIRSNMRQLEFRAVQAYYHRGLQALAQGDVDTAIIEFEQGLKAVPGQEKLKMALKDAVARKEAQQLYIQAMRNIEIRNYRQAQEQLEKALHASPNYEPARAELANVRKLMQKGSEQEFALTSDAPIDLNFRQTDLRTAFGFLANAFGINVIFDESIREKEVTLYAKDVSFRQALNLILATSRTFYRKVGDNTILVAPDTKDKRGQYEDYIIRTFQLTHATAKEVADVLKGVISLQKVVINERLNTLTIRDTQDGLALAERVIANADAKPAEMILEVEILEVNRTKAEQLGFDFGSVITTTFPQVSVSGSFRDALRAGVVTLPEVAFRYFKQDVDAKTLANPKIRVLNGRQAKIHIGDRVPLRAATIQDATGQTRTTFEYSDIGIRLLVEPQINLDNSTMVKLGLEVSSLGQNLGTAAEPTYSIGTRNAETFMLLNDGEIAILGGLIRDEDRKTRIRVPGLGDIPVAGALFTAKDDSVVRTDVLLTITPHVIRPWLVPPESTLTMYSGTAETYSVASRLVAEGPQPQGRRRSANDTIRTAYVPTVGFGELAYATQVGGEVLAELTGANLNDAGQLTVELRFDHDVVEFAEFRAAEGVSVTVEEGAKGALLLSATFRREVTDESVSLGHAIFRPLTQGVANLAIGNGVLYRKTGEKNDLRVHSARMVVD